MQQSSIVAEKDQLWVSLRNLDQKLAKATL